MLMRTEARDRLHGECAINIGYDYGFFEDADTNITYVNHQENPEVLILYNWDKLQDFKSD